MGEGWGAISFGGQKNVNFGRLAAPELAELAVKEPTELA